ncbi:FCD domain-containing protein [Streptomyces sp. NPDC005271]|uniref:FCD domain-containing protein n=1 Tax=unclassified Streptomyces TaxID=2593676 RepID=UPI0033A70982
MDQCAGLGGAADRGAARRPCPEGRPGRVPLASAAARLTRRAPLDRPDGGDDEDHHQHEYRDEFIGHRALPSLGPGRSPPQRSLDRHQRILDAIAERRSKAAATAMRRHGHAPPCPYRRPGAPAEPGPGRDSLSPSPPPPGPSAPSARTSVSPRTRRGRGRSGRPRPRHAAGAEGDARRGEVLRQLLVVRKAAKKAAPAG